MATSPMMDPNAVSRRRVPRRNYECPVGVLVHGRYGIGHTYQIGEGGMMFAAPEVLSVGGLVLVNFFLHGDRPPILVRGVVRSVIPADSTKPECYGIEFENLAFQFKREIRNFVAAGSAASQSRATTMVPTGS